MEQPFNTLSSYFFLKIQIRSQVTTTIVIFEKDWYDFNNNKKNIKGIKVKITDLKITKKITNIKIIDLKIIDLKNKVMIIDLDIIDLKITDLEIKTILQI